MKSAYFRFMALLGKLDDGHPVQDVDVQARQLLDTIALRHHQGAPLTVTTAMSVGDIASPATIHRKLEDLKAKGLVNFEFHGENKRTKYLVPTVVALKRYEKINRELLKTLRTS